MWVRLTPLLKRGGLAVLIGGKTHQEAGFLTTNPAVLETCCSRTPPHVHPCGDAASMDKGTLSCRDLCVPASAGHKHPSDSDP